MNNLTIFDNLGFEYFPIDKTTKDLILHQMKSGNFPDVMYITGEDESIESSLARYMCNEYFHKKAKMKVTRIEDIENFNDMENTIVLWSYTHVNSSKYEFDLDEVMKYMVCNIKGNKLIITSQHDTIDYISQYAFIYKLKQLTFEEFCEYVRKFNEGSISDEWLKVAYELGDRNFIAGLSIVKDIQTMGLQDNTMLLYKLLDKRFNIDYSLIVRCTYEILVDGGISSKTIVLLKNKLPNVYYGLDEIEYIIRPVETLLIYIYTCVSSDLAGVDVDNGIFNVFKFLYDSILEEYVHDYGEDSAKDKLHDKLNKIKQNGMWDAYFHNKTMHDIIDDWVCSLNEVIKDE